MYQKQREELKKLLIAIYNGQEAKCDGYGVRLVGVYIAIECCVTVPSIVTYASDFQYWKLDWIIYNKQVGIKELWRILLGASNRKKSSLIADRIVTLYEDNKEIETYIGNKYGDYIRPISKWRGNL